MALDSRQAAGPPASPFFGLGVPSAACDCFRVKEAAMATSGTVPTDRRSRADWVAVAQELAPAFAARAAGHDTDDTFVSDNYADLRRRRVFSAAVPAELGGDSGLAVASRACAGRRSP